MSHSFEFKNKEKGRRTKGKEETKPSRPPSLLHQFVLCGFYYGHCQMAIRVSNLPPISFFFFFKFYQKISFGHTVACGSSWHHSSNTAGSLTSWTTRELPCFISWFYNVPEDKRLDGAQADGEERREKWLERLTPNYAEVHEIWKRYFIEICWGTRDFVLHRGGR